MVNAYQEIDVKILGMRHVWCRFDSAIYKHPGAGPVKWHQDYSWSTTGVLKRSEHFLDSPTITPPRYPSEKSRPGTTLAAQGTGEPSNAGTVGVPLSIDNLSFHTPWTRHGSGSNMGAERRQGATA